VESAPQPRSLVNGRLQSTRQVSHEIIAAYSGPPAIMNPRCSSVNPDGDRSELSHDFVRDHVAHILSTPGFARSERLKRFLRYTVERYLAGDTDNLKEYTVALEVFDRPPEYNPKIDALVRVEARRLRMRLDQYYATEGMHDSIRIQFPSGTYVPLILRTEVPASPQLKPRGPAASRRWWLLAGGLAVVAIAVVVLRLPVHHAKTTRIVRLIRDSAAAFDPAVSADGRMLAYASDQSGNVDIWVRALGTGDPRRLTSDQGIDASPDFSPDATQIVFRSERNGGGVYLIPAAGGPERLLVPLGRSPKFSPDGKWIAYWTGENHHFEGKTYVVPSTGGNAVRVGDQLADAKWPLWSSDGKTLLIHGSLHPASAGGAVPGPTDLFLVPIDGGPTRQTGWTAALRRVNIWSQGPVSWNGALLQFSAITTPATDFSGLSQGVANLWQMRLSQRHGQVEGDPTRVTFGSALEGNSVLLPGGGTVYSSSQYTLTPFEILLDERGMPRSELRPVFSSAGSYVMPRVSRNGSTVVALSDRSGQVEICLRNLHTGEERSLTSSSAPERAPLISSDGSTIFFGLREGPLYPMYQLNARGGPPQKVCADCGSASDVSSKGDFVLYHTGEPWSAHSLKLANGNRTLILAHGRRTYSSRFSRDGKWVTFLTDTGRDEAPRRILVAPFEPDQTIPDSKWIPVTDGEHRDFDPSWSNDGAMLYFLSDRDGNRCLWAIRVDRESKRPISDAFPIFHLHRMATHIPVTSAPGVFGVSPGEGRLVFGAAEMSSTIYRVESPN
jgi:Tol biopolymer transport system component